MDAITLLHTRYSVSKLGESAPSPEAVRGLLDDTVKSALGIDTNDLIVGVIHVGKDIRAPKTRPPRSPQEFVRHRTGAAAT
jgi:hypothetical protein